jgi:hypothetical protein
MVKPAKLRTADPCASLSGLLGRARTPAIVLGEAAVHRTIAAGARATVRMRGIALDCGLGVTMSVARLAAAPSPSSTISEKAPVLPRRDADRTAEHEPE